jgi:cytochrome c peroxidase
MHNVFASILIGFAVASVCLPVFADTVLEGIGAYYFNSINISRDKGLACASCHVAATAWQDGYERALARHVVLSRNAPTLYNVNRYRSYFWDGRASSLEEQIAGPMFAKLELNSSNALLAIATKDCPIAMRAWQESKLPVQEFVKSALAAHIRAISRGKLRFEEFLAGRGTLSIQETEGYKLFTNTFGCVACHRLPHLTDDSFHDIGLPRRKLIIQTIETRGPATRERLALGYDYGRANISDKKEDLHAFRTPSLFHVTSTAPYMHDGVFHSLPEVLDFYSRKRASSGLSAITEQQKGALLALLQAFSDFEPTAPPTSPCPGR